MMFMQNIHDIFSLCVFVGKCGNDLYVEVGEQLVQIGFLLLPCDSQECNSVVQLKTSVFTTEHFSGLFILLQSIMNKIKGIYIMWILFLEDLNKIYIVPTCTSCTDSTIYEK